ncbi:MAG: ATP-binding cassette domain-containing protein, partial [Candidatus Margulisiibacteriota bacterium]
GKNLYALSDQERSEIRRNKFGFIFQSFRLFSGLTVIENVALSLDINGTQNSEDIAKHFLNEVGLADRFNHYPNELSGGEMQRVAIARALSTKPDLIIADEPTGNLDQKNSDLVKDLLNDCLDKSNASLILVTHDLNLATMCSDIYTISNGNISK